MITALIIAGGVGSRMGSELPKQFIHVGDKPVIIHTLEAFERHPQIDDIVVVCLDGWDAILLAYAKQFGITKLSKVVPGGASGQESIRNGVYELRDGLSDDDLVVIHDGVRPLINADVISDVIRVGLKHGAAASSLPYNEQIFIVDPNDSEKSVEFIPRETVRRVSTPQAYNYGLLYSKYQEAFSKDIGIDGSNYTNTMMVQLGVPIYLSAGSDRNIKLTTPENLEVFKAYQTIFNGQGN